MSRSGERRWPEEAPFRTARATHPWYRLTVPAQEAEPEPLAAG